MTAERPRAAELSLIRAGYPPAARDTDLDPPDRRDRPAPLVDAANTALAPGDAVQFPHGEGVVLGHGRGRGWIDVAWIEVDGATRGRCRGTFRVSDVVKL